MSNDLVIQYTKVSSVNQENIRLMVWIAAIVTMLIILAVSYFFSIAIINPITTLMVLFIILIFRKEIYKSCFFSAICVWLFSTVSWPFRPSPRVVSAPA